MPRRTLVLGGGGVTGIAWEIGLIAGLADRGLDLRSADVVIGTSAGSVVGAALGSPMEPRAAYEEQLEPPEPQPKAVLGPWTLVRYAAALGSTRDLDRGVIRLGTWAAKGSRTDPAERVAVFEAGLPSHEWPLRFDLRVTATSTVDGRLHVFDRACDVPLPYAVAASCAVPLVWPPVVVDGVAYLDGGMRSPANVDLAQGSSAVVVIAPLVRAMRHTATPAAQLAALRLGERGVLVAPSRTALRAIGRNLLDPARRAASARAGYADAALVRDRVARAWTAHRP
ncbi:MAG: patatin-like phospholipase family protein [Dermatophilaceae bacterium]